MEILVIEDDRLKCDRLLSFLKEHFPNSIPKVERSYQRGLTIVEEETFDVVLLDMTLPTFNSALSPRLGRTRALGGVDILRKMRRKNANTKVIVVSALGGFGTGESTITFKELSKQCAEEFPNNFIGAVFFQQANSKWERPLLNFLRKVKRADG